ncbi:MAG: PEP-CTERM sorting domain-containing protein [Armatimonadota bacterium]
MKPALFLGLLGLATLGYGQNLLLNPGFEAVPDNSQGQGYLPNDWITISSSPDTYTNDGSYGLAPTAFGNFTGITAHSGNAWVAGWSAGPEAFGQTLAAPLTGNQTYTLSGWLHQAVRGDLDNPGGYQISLLNSSDSSFVVLTNLGDTVSVAQGWRFYSSTFVAPSNTANFDTVVFSPTTAGGGSYPGIDDVSLTPVPEPASIGAITIGLAVLARRRRK